MKKILGIILTSALLWSCGSQFSRSKYDRFMWNRSHEKTEAKEDLVEETSANTTVTKDASDVVTPVSDLKVIPNTDAETITLTDVRSTESGVKKSENTVSRLEITKYRSLSELPKSKNKVTLADKIKHKVETVSTGKINHSPMQSGDVDAMWIVTLIMCFFIPPLGVYLKDGSITGLFWLVLIFCLLGGGILFGFPGYLGGLYGVGVVLALLRFFDII